MKLIGRRQARRNVTRLQVAEALNQMDVYTEARLVRTQRNIEVARMAAARRRLENS